MRQRKSKAPGKAEGPLSIRRNRKSLIAESCRHVCHAPADTRGTERANLARKCEKLFVRAVLAANARKASAQHTALKIATKLILYVTRIARACRATGASLGKERLGVGAHEPIQHCVFWMASDQDLWSAWSALYLRCHTSVIEILRAQVASKRCLDRLGQPGQARTAEAAHRDNASAAAKDSAKYRSPASRPCPT